MRTSIQDGAEARSAPRWAMAMAIAVGALALLVTVAGTLLRVYGASGDGWEAITNSLASVAIVIMVAGFLAGARHGTGSARRAWRWFAAGGLVYLAGELTWDVQYFAFGAPDDATIADVFWLAAYPFFFIALHMRSREPGRAVHRGEGLIESLIVMGLFAILLWKLTLDSGVTLGSGFASAAVVIAYPVVDLALLWMLLRNVYGAGRLWSTERSLLAVGLLALVIGDTLWFLPAGHMAASYADLAYVVFGLSLAGAGLAGATSGRERRSPARVKSRPLLIDLMPYAAGLGVGGFVPVWQMVTGDRDPAVTFTAVAVLVLVFMRLAMAVRQNRRMRELAEQAALKDNLTGLWNHRYFQERLDEEVARARRAGTTVGLLMIDVDRFKQVNDTAGHLVGDRLLQELGRVVDAAARPSDTPCRVGGDELALIVPGIARANLGVLAERLLEASAKISSAIEDGAERGHLPVSLSIGGAVYPADAANKRTLIHSADLALYRSKRAGGNRFTAHEQEPGPTPPHRSATRPQAPLPSPGAEMR